MSIANAASSKVPQSGSAKTSSITPKPIADYYRFVCTLRYLAKRPAVTEIRSGYIIGMLGSKNVDLASVPDPPHVELANLREDSDSARTFVAKWGPLNGIVQNTQTLRSTQGTPLTDITVKGANDSETAIIEFLNRHPEAANQDIFFERFSVSPQDRAMSGMAMLDLIAGHSVKPALFRDRDTLRQAWEGDSKALEYIRRQIGHYMRSSWGFQGDKVEIQPQNLWSFVCILFLHHREAGRTAVCGNPNCPARYFLKRRRTQKFCEAGPCVEYAQRQYALKWWNSEGKKRRAKAHQKKKGKAKE